MKLSLASELTPLLRFCLNALSDDRHVMNIAGQIVNNTGRDFDNDGVTNVEEFKVGTSPCLQ
ncbi:MAG: hypothetical protein ACRD8Z_04480 [Nitrososphaeraceae archaeon]|jgi:hypothetical protein